MKSSMLSRKVHGCLLGGLIGDAMGAPVECWDYKKIEAKYGVVNDFKGEGTDDSAIKIIICNAIIENDGYAGVDELAESFLKSRDKFELFYIPVRNMFHKIETGISLPVNAGLGNMQSSSSAMSISPVGLINACNPRQAALEAFELAGLIHSGDTSFCRDAAAAIAASVAEAMKVSATVESILESAVMYLNKKSGAEMLGCINDTLKLARKLKDYKKFRKAFTATMVRQVICDSRETVPVALALFYLAKGDPAKTIIYGANFGRDTDTIATMGGSIAGAFKSVNGISKEWIKKIENGNSNQIELTKKLMSVIVKRNKQNRKNISDLEKLF